jgi:quercetin dioxygenase-like cupin family protein
VLPERADVNRAIQEQKMKKMVVFLSLAFSALAVGSASAGTGKATTLMTKDLPDGPGKEGMVEIVDFAPGEVSQPHRHNADLFVYVLEGSVVTQVKGGSAKTVHAGEVFYESPTDIHTVSRNASETQPAKLLVFYLKAKGAPPTVVLRRNKPFHACDANWLGARAQRRTQGLPSV